jgi:hypothetical protein
MRLSTLFALAGLASLVVFVVAPAAPAQPAISINFVATAGPNPGGTLNPTDIAGAVPFANWNNVSAANGTTNNLMTNTGTTTAVSVTVSNSPNTWSIPANQLPNTPDGVMMQGYIDTNATSITMVALSGLTAAGFTGPYNVLVYGVGDANTGRSGDYTLGSQSFRMVDDQQFNGTFRLATAPGGSGAGQSGNYVLFTGVTGDSFVLTAQATQDLMGFRAPINGVQIILPVPEPGHILLACAAVAGGLAAWRRRAVAA